jgi:hypothetical protein
MLAGVNKLILPSLTANFATITHIAMLNPIFVTVGDGEGLEKDRHRHAGAHKVCRRCKHFDRLHINRKTAHAGCNALKAGWRTLVGSHML